MTNRLAELIRKAKEEMKKEDLSSQLAREYFVAEYLLANGVIVLPCKLGDTVYRIIEMGTGIHYKQVGRCGIGHTQGYKIVPCPEKIKRFIRPITVTKGNFFDVCEQFSKTVFLTKEEAEAELSKWSKEDA